MDLSKLTSRKLVITVATVSSLIAAKAYAEAAGVAAAYVLGQGYVDAKTAKSAAHVLGTLDEVIDAVKDELDAQVRLSDLADELIMTQNAEDTQPIMVAAEDAPTPTYRPA